MSHLLLCHHADVGDIPGYDHPDRYTVTERAEQAAVIRAKLAAKFTDQCVDNEAPDGEGDDEEGTLPETPIEGTGNEFVTLNDLAERFEVDKEATRKRLERWRKPAGNPKDWMLHPDPTRTTGDYLYRVNAVRSICEKSASG